jgi:hypothetical protein
MALALTQWARWLSIALAADCAGAAVFLPAIFKDKWSCRPLLTAVLQQPSSDTLAPENQSL